MHYEGLILIGAGLFSIVGAAFDWDWFMGSRRAAFFVKVMTRVGARVFYIALGVVIAVLGGLILVGVIKPS